MKIVKHREHCIKVLAVLIVLVLGIVAEISVKICHYVWFYVNNLDNLCLTLIGIHATMTSLIYAVVAFLSGYVGKSYYGISVCSYILDIKQPVFKFKYVLVFELILLLVMILFQILHFYNLIITCAVASILVVWSFIEEINDIFNTSSSIVKGIKVHFLRSVKKNDNYKEIGYKFIESWKKEIFGNQSEEDFNTYSKLFIKYVSKRMYSDIDIVNRLSIDLAQYMLTSDNDNNKIKGLKFISYFYHEVFNFIIRHADKIDRIKGPIYLISKVIEQWWSAVVSSDFLIVAKNVQFDQFYKNVLRVESLINKNADKSESISIFQIVRWLGGYRKEQDDDWLYSQLLNDLYYDHYWFSSLLNDCPNLQEIFRSGTMCNLSILLKNFPDKQEILNSVDRYDYSLLLLRFNVYLNYIKKANLSFVKKYVFEDTSSFSSTNNYEYTVIEKIVVHLYLYYLCFDTDHSFIDKFLRSKISGLLRDKKVISYMYSLFVKANERCFSLSWEKEVEQTIQKDQFCMLSNASGEYVDNLKGTVANYFLYIRLMVPSIRNNLKNNYSEYFCIDDLHSYLSQVLSESSAKRLLNLGKIIEKNISIGEIKNRLNAFYQVLDDKYKQHIIATAKDNSERLNKDKESVTGSISEELVKVFQPLFNLPEVSYGYFNKKKITITTTQIERTDVLLLSGFCIDLVVPKIFKLIIQELINKFGIKNYSRRNYKTNIKFQDLLYDYNLLIGDRSLFNEIEQGRSGTYTSDDYNKWILHSNFIDSFNNAFIFCSCYGIVTKIGEINFKLDKVSTALKTVTQIPTNNNCIKPKDQNTYLYEDFEGCRPTEFNIKDCLDFVQDAFKSVEICMDISVTLKLGVNYESVILEE